MLVEKNKTDEKKDKSEENKTSGDSEKKVSFKKYVALKTIKITANGTFNLIKDQEIPKEIDKAFIESLVSSNLIKLIK